MKISINRSYLTKAERSQVAYEDVDYIETQRANMRNDLQYAVVLGNTLDQEVMLFAKSASGLVTIQAQVSSTTERDVVLKGGDLIPINAIHCVTLW